MGLTQWLGFTLTRNPFILPVNLEARAKLEAPSSPIKASGGASHSADIALHRLQRDDSSSQFVQVGGKRAQDDRAQLSSAARRAQAAAAKALAERKRPKNPYETRIINDEELVPLPHHRGTSARGNDTSSRPTTSASSASAFLLPSQIGDIDMARIRACETIVLQEEALHGRYTRDIQGQLVPEAEAVRRRNMIEMSGDAYASSHVNIARIEGGISEEQRRIKEDEDAHARPSAKVIAKKRAGMLGPIGKPQRTCSCPFMLMPLIKECSSLL
ncbi:hypothetical protein PINS_up015619 [Pythium insidiosum]|nr:hypothetical protein PINS_up015619 [Pythium insidiosum]